MRGLKLLLLLNVLLIPILINLGHSFCHYVLAYFFQICIQVSCFISKWQLFEINLRTNFFPYALYIQTFHKSLQYIVPQFHYNKYIIQS